MASTPVFHQLLLAASVSAAGIAAFTDTRSGRIPNWVTLPPMVMAPVVTGFADGRMGVMSSVFGIIAGAAVPWMMFRSTKARAIGGGDVKLFAALGALLGPVRGLEVELGAFGLLAFFAIVTLAYRGQLLDLVLNIARLAASPVLPRGWRRPVPAAALTSFRMGPAILVAVIVNATLECLGRSVPWLA